MSVSVANGRQWLNTIKSLGYYAVLLGVISSILYVLKTFILQVLGILVIGVFVAIGFYYLAYLLFGIISLFIIIGSVIAAIGFSAYIFG
ncbi:hypothetical protein [Bacillus pseudomycoides]|uniref:hypothetical protein n=1 Tax=Bacillus pseudomycoides TaxID=64104 RepID=UPI000BED89B2|nr:hypothetical protein [Bacillus pseudomycoides]MED4653601.1 hypothetical protein [Bacillus pseudomycoides]PEE03323.1 hypothetical protein CON86_25900 [Bacillus pseudomycoides]PEM73638.1 hypothetical protein CN632_21370 [Bacillus pseudomycoides]PHC90402.1 hypothetical protein COF63_00015 [Bacillus pseudomycoides]